MSMLDGVSQCWVLSKDCVVWWDAWAVMVGVVVGSATTFVAYQAWITSRHAASIAETATDIAKQQKHDADLLRESERKGLEQVLYEEVVGLGIRTSQLRDLVTFGTDFSTVSGVGHAYTLNDAFKHCQEDWLPVTRSLRDKLYLLDHGHGEVLSQLIGDSIAIKAIAGDLASEWHYQPAANLEEEDSWVYGGDSASLFVLWKRVDEAALLSLLLAGQFAERVQRYKLL